MAADRKINNELISRNFSPEFIHGAYKNLQGIDLPNVRTLPDLKIDWNKVNADFAAGSKEQVSTEKTFKATKPWYQKKVFQKAAIAAGFAGSVGGVLAVHNSIENSSAFTEVVPAIHTEIDDESLDLQTEQQEPQILQNDRNEADFDTGAISRLTAGDYKELAEVIYQGNLDSVKNRDLVYPGQVLAVNDAFKAVLESKGIKAEFKQIVIENGNGISQQVKAQLEKEAGSKLAEQGVKDKENLQSAEDSGKRGEVEGSDEIREDGNGKNDSGELKNLENEPTPSATAVATSTVQPSRTPTATPLPLASLTPSVSPTLSSTVTSSPSPAPRPSSTPAATVSSTVSPTREATVSPTPISTPCPLSPSPTAAPEGCPTPPPCPSSEGKIPIIDCVTPSPSPTPEPTISPRASPTPGPSPEPSPTPTATAEPCIATDVKGELNDIPGRLHFSNNPVRGVVSNIAKNAACSDDIYIHVYGSMQFPETPGWIESQRGNHIETRKILVREGAVDEPFEYFVPNKDFCWYQVDLTRDGEIKNEPRYITNDYVFVKDADSCLPPVPTVTVTVLPQPDVEPGPPQGTRTATPIPTAEAPRPTATATATPRPAEPIATPTASPTPEPPVIATPTPTVPVPGITGMLGLADKSNRERLNVSSRDEKLNFIPLFAGTATLAFAAFAFSKRQEQKKKLSKRWIFKYWEDDEDEENESSSEVNL